MQFGFSGLKFTTTLWQILLSEWNNPRDYSSEVLAEQRRYYNNHVAIYVDMLALERNSQPPVLTFQNYHNLNKVSIVVYAEFRSNLGACTDMYQYHIPYSYSIYIKVDNDLILVSKTTSLPTNMKL
ncbi:hypothetical protein PR048_005097 [Dryococelus australis]|uniref:Uncharacterized protein n=1 Tax=Dryococelus australis TaxID=614101 RepID=A0ABQ9I790_9NEOP|nr:hypothetical protein PR048_005097 [Dryococelus australis]